MRSDIHDTGSAGSVAALATDARQAALLGRLTIAGIALYVILDVVAQLLPPHYSPISQAESELAVGPYGYVMAINFVVRGLLSLALLLGLRRGVAPAGRSRAGIVLLAVWTAGALLLAFFPTDLPGERTTLHGVVHLVAALVAFVGVALGELLISRRFAADPRWSDLRAPALTIASLALLALLTLLLGFRAQAIYGLIERVFLALALGWMLLVARRLSALAQRPTATAS